MLYCFLGGTNAIHLRAIKQSNIDLEHLKGEEMYESYKNNFFNINNTGGKLIKLFAQLAPVIMVFISLILIIKSDFLSSVGLLIAGWLFFYSLLPVWLNNYILNTRIISMISALGILIEPYLFYNLVNLILVIN